MYGAAILANIKTIAEHGDLVKRFVKATLESLHWAAQNPEAAIVELRKSNPQLKEDRALAEFKSILEVSIPRGASVGNPLQLGWVENKKMAHTIDLVRESYGLKETLDPEVIYTNAYVAKP